MHLVIRIFRTGVAAMALTALAACTTPTVQRQPTTPSVTPKAAPKLREQPTQPLKPLPEPKPLSDAQFIRPAPGVTLAAFDGKGKRGIDIDGKLGDPIVAAASGRVVYAGNELQRYGNMVVIKHDETYLTAYAHTQVILVQENTVVHQGQKIAQMGETGTDADRVKLHFEIRKDGQPVDPAPYLSGPPS